MFSFQCNGVFLAGLTFSIS